MNSLDAKTNENRNINFENARFLNTVPGKSAINGCNGLASNLTQTE